MAEPAVINVRSIGDQDANRGGWMRAVNSASCVWSADEVFRGFMAGRSCSVLAQSRKIPPQLVEDVIQVMREVLRG